MGKLLCWLFGHERTSTSARHRVCYRCGLRERQLQIGDVIAWEDLTPRPIRR